MKAPPRRDLELNELGWWANWATAQRLGRDAYLLSSEDFPEVFFNRGVLLSCDSEPSLKGLEALSRTMGATPALTVFGSCQGMIRTLVASGYQRKDTFVVMIAAPGVGAYGRRVEARPAENARDWAEAYLKAFYGEVRLLPAVAKIVGPLVKDGSTTLLEAEVDGKVAGTLAAFRTEGLMGVYCVGTVPEFRRRGVAGALLAHARALASSEGRTILLQTLESDGVVPFYQRRGFRILYRKILMMKKG